MNELINFYWAIKNIEIIEAEFNKRRGNDRTIDKNTSLIQAFEKLEYDELLQKETIEKLEEIPELKNQTEIYEASIKLIRTLIESLSTENKILEELKNRRKSLIEFSRQFSDLITLSEGECPTCGHNWDSNEELLKEIENTEIKIFSTYNLNNSKLEEEKKKLKNTFLNIMKSHLSVQNELLEKQLKDLTSYSYYEEVKEKEVNLNVTFFKFLK